MHRARCLGFTLLCFALFSAVLGFSRPARAEGLPRLTDWAAIYEKVAPSLTKERIPEVPLPDVTKQLGHLPEMGSTWFSLAPRPSLHIRDWACAKHLAGGQLLLIDAMRAARTSRMLVSRVRFGEAGTRLVPFAQAAFGQAAFGQWRRDAALMPVRSSDAEIATQLGTGIEVRVAEAWQLAAEADVTVLYRDPNEAGHVTAPRMWGTFLASRVEF